MARPGQSAGPYLEARSSEPPRELWRSPTNVVIEEARAPGADISPPPRQTASMDAASTESPARFNPAAPEDVRRPSSRRVPGLDEFPPVGQREYRAKSAQIDAATASHEPLMPEASSAHDQRARGGLLQRMIGTAKKSIRQ